MTNPTDTSNPSDELLNNLVVKIGAAQNPKMFDETKAVIKQYAHQVTRRTAYQIKEDYRS